MNKRLRLLPVKPFLFLRMTFAAVLFFFLLTNHLSAQILDNIKLRDGDLVFQDLSCGPLCDAIEEVTVSYGNRRFSHLGMVVIQQDSIFLLEAIGKSVQLTPMSLFGSRTKEKMLVGRVRKQFASVLPGALQFAEKQLGVPYDDEFLYQNGKYYCSELIYDAFKAGNDNKDFFELQPMTFKQPGSDKFFPVWISYYANLGIPIPQGKPGINPGGISMSDRIEILYR